VDRTKKRELLHWISLGKIPKRKMRGKSPVVKDILSGEVLGPHPMAWGKTTQFAESIGPPFGRYEGGGHEEMRSWAEVKGECN